MRVEQINRASSRVLIVRLLQRCLRYWVGTLSRPNRTKARRRISFSCQSWRWCRWSYFSSRRRIGGCHCAALDYWQFQQARWFSRLERCITLNTTG